VAGVGKREEGGEMGWDSPSYHHYAG